MSIKASKFLLFFAVILLGSVCALAQGDASKSILPDPNDKDKEDRPLSLRETFAKMRIEKDKKDHDEMISRGEDVQRMAEQIDKSYTANGKFTDDDIARLSAIEQNLKKIRNELGGRDDDELLLPDRGDQNNAWLDAFKSFEDSTNKLVDELKKTTRFTISAAAIESTNTVLRLARFLKITRK